MSKPLLGAVALALAGLGLAVKSQAPEVQRYLKVRKM
jgi:hypothetical protein